MTENSKIEWCDATWQVTHGCKKVAAGCANCYAIRDAHRMAGHPNPKISEPRQGLTKWVHRSPNERAFVDWTGVVRTAPENLAIPLRWKKPKRIFVNSNSDLFHESVPFEFIAAVYGVMAACPRHTFMVLTKRPERMLEFMRWLEKHVAGPMPSLAAAYMRVGGGKNPDMEYHDIADRTSWPLPNVWHGTSISDQATADRNIPILLQVPSAKRFVSAEPLLEEVDLSAYLWRTCSECRGRMYVGPDGSACNCAKYSPRPGHERLNELHWVIVGGESGSNARPCDVAWIRSIVEQCEAAGVPCFVKQVGSRPFDPSASDDSGCDCPQWTERCEADDHPRGFLKLKDRKGADPSEWPEEIRVREYPEVKHAAL